MESQSWNLAKSPEEENTENVVINNHQAKWFCKKKTGYILESGKKKGERRGEERRRKRIH